MSTLNNNRAGEETGDGDDITAVYGVQDSRPSGLTDLEKMRRDFAPWHHPVKQHVRSRQWASLTEKLLEERAIGAPRVLRYFTLPGADLFDVRALSEVCSPRNVKVEYFGFNAGNNDTEKGQGSGIGLQTGPWVMAESELRQAGRITENAQILGDRLEDIAVHGSQASIQLQQRGVFDVVNIDACDHLAYMPKERTENTFDALKALLQHQMGASIPWLLFITTRVSPELSGTPGLELQNAVHQNLCIKGSHFGEALAECLKANLARIAGELPSIWSTHDERFLKLYTIGLGKFLLQFFHGQPNLPANVELKSAFAYRVHSETPDMLALAFKITPDPRRVFPGQTGASVAYSTLEPIRAIEVAKSAMKLNDIDTLLEANEFLRNDAILGMQSLLMTARYDIPSWRAWLASHRQRPMSVD